MNGDALERPTQIKEQVEALCKKSGQLFETATRLRERLSDILIMPDTAKGSSEQPREPLVPLANELEGVSNSLSGTLEILNDILENCHL